MNVERCEREDELLDALGRGYVGDELGAHTAACSACTELRSVAGALLDDRAGAMLEATVPSAGTMWWRMRLRHRQEAEAQARRSLLIGQAATLAIALTMVIAFFGTDIRTVAKEMFTTIRLSTPLLIAAAVWLLVTPIAGWVAVRQK